MNRIFGREPAAVMALLGAVVMVASRLLHWSPDVQGAVNAAVMAGFGLVTMWLVGTRGDGLLAGIVGFSKAVIAVALGFGLHVAADDQVLVMTVVTIVSGFFLRTQMTAPQPKSSS